MKGKCRVQPNVGCARKFNSSLYLFVLCGSSSDLIQWAAENFDDAIFLTYEQVNYDIKLYGLQGIAFAE